DVRELIRLHAVRTFLAVLEAADGIGLLDQLSVPADTIVLRRRRAHAPSCRRSCCARRGGREWHPGLAGPVMMLDRSPRSVQIRARDRTCTRNLPLTRRLLYQLSYAGRPSKGTKTSSSSRMVPLPAQRGLLGCAKTPLMLFEHSKLLHSSGRCAPGKDGTSARFRSSSLGLTGAQTSDLVEGHTGCHGGVEGLRVADRDVHDLVAVLPHESGQALALGTHDE